MSPHLQFPHFAFLTLVCVAVSSCTSTNLLSTDPQTEEDILQASREHPARVTLINGDTVNCYAVSLRRDSTRWRLTEQGAEFSVPTDSVHKIEVGKPMRVLGSIIGACLGMALSEVPAILLGAVGGGIGYVIGDAIVPKNTGLYGMVGIAIGLITGGAAAVTYGAIEGWNIGASNGTIWTKDTTQTKLPH